MLFNVFHSHMLALISCLFAIEEQHESPHRRGDICLSIKPRLLLVLDFHMGSEMLDACQEILTP